MMAAIGIDPSLLRLYETWLPAQRSPRLGYHSSKEKHRCPRIVPPCPY